METFIYWVGVKVTSLIVLYAIIYLLYLKLELKVHPEIQTNAMPVLKPVAIPTKNQKTPIHKLAVFVIKVREWEVVENWHYTLNDEVELIIPKGFRFDGASIPRPLWAILNPIGLLLIPGLLHDYGYKHDQLWQLGPDGEAIAYKKAVGKDFWDSLFKTVGKDVNGFFLINVIAWLAVILGGNRAWKKHRMVELKAQKPNLSL